MKGLILIYLITAAATIGGLRNPRFALYVYVGFAVLRPQNIFGFAGDMSGLSNYVGISMLLGWAFNGFGSWRLGRARLVVVALFAFVGWFALSGELGLDPSRSRESLLEFSKVVLPVIVGATTLTDPKHWRTLLWVIVLAEGYVGFEMNNDYYMKSYNTASTGFGVGDNNFFGLSLVTVLGPAVALAISSRTWTQRLLAAAAAAFILHTVLLTFSRGAMVGLLAVAATALIIIPKRPKYMLPVLATIGLGVWLTGPELAERYMTTFAPAEERDGSSESRLDLWADCLLVIERYPIFGVGPANWRVIVQNYGWPAGKSAHSVWMETAAETGIPGVMFLMLFFLIPLFKLWPIARKRRPGQEAEQAMAMGAVLSVVGFAVTGQFVSGAGMEEPYYVITAAIGMLRQPVTRLSSAMSANAVEPVTFATQLARLSKRPVPASLTVPRQLPEKATGG